MNLCFPFAELRLHLYSLRDLFWCGLHAVIDFKQFKFLTLKQETSYQSHRNIFMMSNNSFLFQLRCYLSAFFRYIRTTTFTSVAYIFTTSIHLLNKKEKNDKLKHLLWNDFLTSCIATILYFLLFTKIYTIIRALIYIFAMMEI
jgi:hypothetical protein